MSRQKRYWSIPIFMEGWRNSATPILFIHCLSVEDVFLRAATASIVFHDPLEGTIGAQSHYCQDPEIVRLSQIDLFEMFCTARGETRDKPIPVVPKRGTIREAHEKSRSSCGASR